jgi:hypothetical protein
LYSFFAFQGEYFETSAKLNVNVREPFQSLIKAINLHQDNERKKSRQEQMYDKHQKSSQTTQLQKSRTFGDLQQRHTPKLKRVVRRKISNVDSLSVQKTGANSSLNFLSLLICY